MSRKSKVFTYSAPSFFAQLLEKVASSLDIPKSEVIRLGVLYLAGLAGIPIEASEERWTSLVSKKIEDKHFVYEFNGNGSTMKIIVRCYPEHGDQAELEICIMHPSGKDAIETTLLPFNSGVRILIKGHFEINEFIEALNRVKKDIYPLIDYE